MDLVPMKKKEKRMSKIKFLEVFTKCLAYITLAITNIFRLFQNVGKRTIDNLNFTKRYRVEIFHGQNQMEVKDNVNHKQLLSIIDTLDVIHDMNIIVTKSPLFEKE